MKKVIVIGSPGAGKSTFARKLRNVTGLPVHYLDMLWHKVDRTTVSREEFDLKLGELFKQDRWIIDGNYYRTLEVRLRECDTVFLLDFPLEVCLSGAEARIGQKREDMPWVAAEFDAKLRQWIIDFHRKKLPEIYALLEIYQNEKEIVIFKSRSAADRYLEGI